MEQATLSAATVIGAGPAGALTAALLARRGVDVTLLDKQLFPRAKVCGCCLSPNAISALRHAGYEHILDELDAVPLTRMHLYHGLKRIELRLDNSYSLSRAAFDNALVEAAQKEGARFQSGVSCTVGDTRGFHRIVDCDNREFLTKTVICADGLTGASLRYIAELRSEAAPQSKIGTGTISHCRDMGYERGIIYMCVGEGGYAGLVRLEDDSLDIAAALTPEYLRRMHNPADAIAKLLHASRLPIPSDLLDLEWRGTVALTRRRAHIAAERIFVVGDSASYIEPFTGEGIAWALIGALNVVPLAARAAVIWNDSLAQQWEHVYRREIATRQRKTAVVASLLNNGIVRGIGAEVMARVPTLSSLIVETVHA